MKILKRIFWLTILVCFGCSNSKEADDSEIKLIKINSDSGNVLDIFEKDTLQLTARAFNESNNVVESSFEWSSSNNHISVSDKGVVTPNSVGDSKVIVSADNATASFDVKVVDSTPEKGTFIYVSDAGNFNDPPWQILRYNEDGSNPKVFINSHLAWPQDIVFLEDRNEVLISNVSSGNIGRHNASSGSFINNFATNLSGPTRIRIGEDSLLYVLQWSGNGLVLRFDLDGNPLGSFTKRLVTQAIGMAWDKEGNFYVSSFADATVRKFSSEGEDLGIFISRSLIGPTDIWFDRDGNMLINDWSGDAVVKFSSDGTYLSHIVNTGIDQVEGVAILKDQSFLVGSGGTGEVKLYDTNGKWIQNLVRANSGGLLTPNAVVIREIK